MQQAAKTGSHIAEQGSFPADERRSDLMFVIYCTTLSTASLPLVHDPSARRLALLAEAVLVSRLPPFLHAREMLMITLN